MLSKKHIICHLSVIFPWCFPTFSSFHHHFSSCWFSPWKSRGCSKHSYILRRGNGYFSPPDLPNHLPGDAASPQRSGGETSRGDLDRVTWYLGRRWRIPLIFRGLTDISLGFFFFFLSCERSHWRWWTLRDMQWMAEHITGFQTIFQSGSQWDWQCRKPVASLWQ